MCNKINIQLFDSNLVWGLIDVLVWVHVDFTFLKEMFVDLFARTDFRESFKPNVILVILCALASWRSLTRHEYYINFLVFYV